MKTTAKIIAAGATTIALAGGIGAGIAWADPSSPAPTAPATTASPTPGQAPKADRQAKKAGKLHRPLLARAQHGEVTLGGKNTRVVDFQRGTVEQVSATSITVRSKDGFSATYVVDAKTEVRVAKKLVAIGDVHTADRVRVVAVKDGSTLSAKRIGDHGTK